MSALVKAKCQCGYESDDLAIGVGMLYPSTNYDGEPAYCDNCGIVTTYNSNEDLPNCKKCGERLHSFIENKPGKPLIAPLIDIFNPKYHCPKCKQPTLQFDPCGLWD